MPLFVTRARLAAAAEGWSLHRLDADVWQANAEAWGRLAGLAEAFLSGESLTSPPCVEGTGVDSELIEELVAIRTQHEHRRDTKADAWSLEMINAAKIRQQRCLDAARSYGEVSAKITVVVGTARTFRARRRALAEIDRLAGEHDDVVDRASRKIAVPERPASAKPATPAGRHSSGAVALMVRSDGGRHRTQGSETVTAEFVRDRDDRFFGAPDTLRRALSGGGGWADTDESEMRALPGSTTAGEPLAV